MKKKILSLGLATTLLMGTVACAANNDKEVISENPDKEVINVEGDVASVVTVNTESNYINHKGKISEIKNENGVVSLVVDQKQVLKDSDERPAMSVIEFNISEDTVVLSDKTREFVKASELVPGMVVEVAYSKDSPVTKSLPPMTNAAAIVYREAKEDEAQLGVKVDRFDGSHTSIDNFLKYNVTGNTKIVSAKGEELTEKDLANKDLVVFYGPEATMSIPAQSNAVKIIVLNNKSKVEKPEQPEKPVQNTEIKILDKITIYGDSGKISAELPLKDKIYKSGDTFMIPLRRIAEVAGYEVSWNNATKQAELKKGPQFITISQGKDMYSFSKMIVKLGKAPEAKKGTMFVPLNFVEEVMNRNLEITQDGMINIK